VQNPDVVTTRTEREAPIKDTITLSQKGDSWLDSHKKHVPKDAGSIRLFSCVAAPPHPRARA